MASPESVPTGLQQMQAIRDGRHPPAPIQDLLGFALAEVDEGRAVFTIVPDERHLNPLGTVHGGIAGTLIDSACGCAVHTTLPPGGGYTTLETSFNLVAAVRPDDGELACEGEVIHRGSRVATAEARMTRVSDGRLVAHGTSTCMIMDLR
jgi:uncharacterized protein (TIGR00369 family)